MNWKLKKFGDLKLEEIYNILQLRNAIFIVEQECAFQDCDGKDQGAYHLFLEDSNNVVACLRILKKGVSYDQVSIGRVVVSKDYRGKNIAREMMLKAIDFIKQNLNETEIKIQAQAYLFNFYESLGFKKVSEEYLEDNIPHMDMLYKQ
ncbi:GNAT family N-acetyltransferase [Clostridium sp. MB40-C1]|uniref:GNAT family N-acetyltransferase n=1 Tax=Clostridium sp. MB40-C1 TaxID=3070996 RepID=UPI0027E0E642|nr:GNAT family N-acetyltransferase [Clostridium sp. MB40-C1]WMJ81789.1 GNAT family N-acetyltransferase [Clostridium sp. MB40-C1]